MKNESDTGSCSNIGVCSVGDQYNGSPEALNPKP